MFVCVCKQVTDTEVDQAVAHGADTVAALGEATGAGTDCGACVKALARRALGRQRTVQRPGALELALDL